MGPSPAKLLTVYGRTLKKVRFSLLTVAAMLSLGYVTRYSGLMGLLVFLQAYVLTGMVVR
jgi:L-lactate permease